MFDITKINKMEDMIGINFNKKELLIEALSHSSYLNENPGFKNEYGLTDGHNERLEYLGDYVLELAVAENLYFNHPGREGDLTAIKTHFVSGKKLAEISNTIGLEQFLIMGRGETDNESGREKRIANSLESLIAAIFIDQGYAKAKEFVNEFILSDFDDIIDNIEVTKIVDNPIGYLQEYCVRMGYGEPFYDEPLRSGPDHSPTFSVEVEIDSERSAKGTGKKVQDAKKDAAMNALKLYVFVDAPDF